jgi:RNA polymerase sigma factor (sigma-70 family)
VAGIDDDGKQRVRGVPPPYRSFAGFVSALKNADRAALRLAYQRYMPLLRDQARKLGVPAEECDELSATVLADVLLHLQRTDVPPRDFTRYLVSALRNRARNGHRDRRRLAQTQEYAYADLGDGRERVVAECHSAYGLRSSSGADDDTASMTDDMRARSPIEKFALWSAQTLSDVEAALMIGLGHRVPLRELAEQTGLSYGAARIRVHRLRERFRKLVTQYVASLGPDERREMQRFFKRANITLQMGAAMTAKPGSPVRDDANREECHDTE